MVVVTVMQSDGYHRSPGLPTHNQRREVDPEHSRSLTAEQELLKEVGLDEGVGLHTLGLLHRHLQTVATDEACGHLQLRAPRN